MNSHSIVIRSMQIILTSKDISGSSPWTFWCAHSSQIPGRKHVDWGKLGQFQRWIQSHMKEEELVVPWNGSFSSLKTPALRSNKICLVVTSEDTEKYWVQNTNSDESNKAQEKGLSRGERPGTWEYLRVADTWGCLGAPQWRSCQTKEPLRITFVLQLCLALALGSLGRFWEPTAIVLMCQISASHTPSILWGCLVLLLCLNYTLLKQRPY